MKLSSSPYSSAYSSTDEIGVSAESSTIFGATALDDIVTKLSVYSSNRVGRIVEGIVGGVVSGVTSSSEEVGGGVSVVVETSRLTIDTVDGQVGNSVDVGMVEDEESDVV